MAVAQVRFAVLLICLGSVIGQETTAISPEQECIDKSNTSCQDCLKIQSCYWCSSTNACRKYSESNVLPWSVDDCGVGSIKWNACWLNFEALLISVGVLVGLAITMFVVACCCCCGRRRRVQLARDEARWDAERVQRAAKSALRQAQHKKRADEIRVKYGINSGTPYQRFDTQ